MQAIIAPCSVAVDYHKYLLMETFTEPKETELRYMYKVRKHIDELYPTCEFFTGLEPIELLSFLKILKEAIKDLGKSE